MKTRYKKRVALAAALLAILVAGTQQASATLFNFDDIYYITSGHSSTYNNIFGTTAGYSSTTTRYYQETHTASPVTVTIIGLNTTTVGGEYVPNTTPNADSFLALNSFTATPLVNGSAIGSVCNYQQILDGSFGTTFFRYHATGGAGGATTAFNFNGFDLRTTAVAPMMLSIRADLNLTQVDLMNITIPNDGAFHHFDFNWSGVDTISIAGQTGYNYGTDSLFMDNVTINQPVPEPTTMIAAALLLLPFGASTLRVIRKRSAA